VVSFVSESDEMMDEEDNRTNQTMKQGKDRRRSKKTKSKECEGISEKFTEDLKRTAETTDGV
jgi:hypothetical protein